jgi:hypothetical protein
MVLEWTAVKNELPKDMEDVLLFDQEEGEYIGYYYESKKSFIRYIDGFRLKHVTHWMHLPGHPEDHQPTFQQQTLAPLMRQIDRQTNYILLWPSSLASRIHLQLAEHLF